MPWQYESNWNPTHLISVAGSADTSTGATEVMTDAGRAYIKPLGNRQGPHVLATDWVGTHLAHWFGLSTFEIAILVLEADDEFDLPRGEKSEPGPAFAAKAMSGGPWGKSEAELDQIVNPDDITRLIVFDTWTLNCDRHHYDLTARKPNYDNVFLTTEGVEAGKRRLIAMDHGLCFIRSGEELSHKLAYIGKVKDDNLYGLFPEFKGKLRQNIIGECCSRLREMDEETASAIVATVPVEWQVTEESRRAWVDLICRRAIFVADHVEKWIDVAAPWFGAKGE
ncbi:MAG: hypothetical protein KF851_03140 [Pirellulaceae bacterium]|nr:hypothetical protein [Pirellulaceae bacterium]